MNQQNLDYRQYVNTILQAPTKQYPERAFHLKQLLGDGGEGGVYLAQPQKWGINTNTLVLKLQKKMKEQEINFIDNIKVYQDEYEIPNTPKYHPSQIIRIYERFQWRTFDVLLMEKGEGDLYNYLQNNSSKMLFSEKVSICKQVLDPIFFLSQQSLLHRDIKSDNYVKVGNVFKLIDFGLIVTNSLSKTKGIGSRLYQAPELYDNACPTSESDVWALGCLFYEIFTGLSLYQKNAETTMNQITQTIMDNIRNQSFFDQKINQLQIPEEFKKIILKMLVCDDKQRATIQEIKGFLQTFKLNSPIRGVDSVFMTAYPNVPNPTIQKQFQQPPINYQEQIAHQQQILAQTHQDLAANLNNHISNLQSLYSQLPSYLNFLQNSLAFFSQQQFLSEQQIKQLDQYLDQAQQIQLLECQMQIQYLGQQTKKYLYHQELFNKFSNQQKQTEQTQLLQQWQSQIQSLNFQVHQYNNQILSHKSLIDQLTKQNKDQKNQFEIENQKLKNEIAQLKEGSAIAQNTLSIPSDFNGIDSKINKSGNIEQLSQFSNNNSQIQEVEQSNQPQKSENENDDESSENKY